MKNNFKTTRRITSIKVIIMLFFMICISAGCDKNQITPGDNNQNPTGPEHKKWTVLFYDDADCENTGDPIDIFQQYMFSGDNVNVLALQDTWFGPGYLWYINDNGGKEKLKDMGEIDMGNYRTLLDFLDYAKTNYPGDRYILSFYDHGHGWMGACRDETGTTNWLTMDEMQRALAEAGGVDMIFFSAPCLMGAAESVYELRDVTDVYISSENLSGYVWWWYAMEDIRRELNNSPNINIYKLGEKVIEYILLKSTKWEEEYQDVLTMSAVRTDKMAALKDALDALSIAYLDNPEHFSSDIDGLYKDIRSYYQFCVDIYDLAEKLLAVTTDPNLRARLEKVKECLQEAVIAECHGKYMSGSHGLTLYLPDKSLEEKYNLLYEDAGHGLDFAADTSWDELLFAYFGPEYSGMRGLSGVLPPPHMSKLREKQTGRRP